ncbi:glycosyltransferase family 39 protein [Polycladidibacter stylochi]|uniref:glycosyltransferase family 39 protein n=1 Tax=Polycladidibacter stylochi TaxID=1807766 RepID=UPI0008330095|nr:glycosyltransferase family 39 protein [Pseudovibrio stylochi]
MITARISHRLESSPALQLNVLILSHVLIWTIVFLAVNYPGGLTDDMLETFSWGQEYAMGYYKHPPFYSWVAGLWFEFFTTNNLNYYLLASLNSAVGLLGVWFVAGRYTRGLNRLAAVLLLELVPLYTLQSYNFNANIFSLSIWPWTVYAFLRSFEDRNYFWTIIFGALGAADVLTKYYGGILLASCVLTSVCTKDWRSYYKSAHPYLSVAVFAACMVPHALWVFSAPVTPFDYLEGKMHGFPYLRKVEKALKTFASGIAFHALLFLCLYYLRKEVLLKFKGMMPRAWCEPKIRILTLVSLLPFVLTIFCGLVLGVKLSSRFLIPAFALVPLWLLVVLQAQCNWRFIKVSSILAVSFALVLVVGSPINSYLRLKDPLKEHIDPRQQVADFVGKEWRKFSHRPMQLAAGTQSYSLAVVYYDPMNPSHYTEFNRGYAPWVHEDMLGNKTMAVICLMQDQNCLSQSDGLAQKYEGGRVKQEKFSSHNRAFWFDGETIEFQLTMLEPAQ